MTNKLIQKHIRSIRANRVWMVLMVILATACIAGAMWLQNACYAAWSDPADGSQGNKIASVNRAINLCPDRLDAYHSMINIYLEDGILQRAEYAQLDALLLQHQSGLTKSDADVAALYRRLAFLYITSYDQTVQQRLEAAYPYFEYANLHGNAESLEQMQIDSYLDISAYYAEYIWLEGTLRRPTAADVTDLLRNARSILDSFPASANTERLAYACVLADVLTQQGTYWTEIAGADTVSAFAAKVSEQLNAAPNSPAEQLLWSELEAWKNENHPWEEVVDNAAE